MCGIYGIIAKNPQGFLTSHTNILEKMGILSQFRGEHGSGVFFVNKKGKASLLKTYGPVCNLHYDDKWEGFKRKIYTDGIIAIGHSRYATSGKTETEDAHPFTSGHIVLVHNGVVDDGIDIKHGEVDSKILCENIEKRGAEETLESVSGAFAIVFYDTKKKELVIYRNEERPLHFAETSDCIYIMSEKEMLEFLLKREKIKFDEIKEYEPHKLIKTNIKKNFSVSSVEVRTKERNTWKGYFERYLKHKPEVVTTSTEDEITFIVERKEFLNGIWKYYAEGDYGENVEFYSSSRIDHIGKIGTAPVATKRWDENKWKFIVLEGKIKWDTELDLLDGDVIKKSDWEKLVKERVCSMCYADIDPNDNDKCIVAGNSVLCPDCADMNNERLRVGL